MKFKMVHENYNVADLEKSIAFYEKALGLHEVRRKNGNGFILVYMGDEESNFELELTWLEEHPQKYDLGECEFHLAFATDDYEAAHKIPMATGWRLFLPERAKNKLLVGFTCPERRDALRAAEEEKK